MRSCETAFILPGRNFKRSKIQTMKKIIVLPVQQLKTTAAAAYPIFLCVPVPA